MEHIKEFSKQANSYNEYSQIQKEVAKYLLSKVKMAPKNIEVLKKAIEDSRGLKK